MDQTREFLRGGRGIENKGESLPTIQKNHPPSRKAKVAVEAIKGHQTASPIAPTEGVHPTPVGFWKKPALAGWPAVFSNGREQRQPQADTEKGE